MFASFSCKVIIMKTMRFLVAMAIVSAVGLGVAGSAGAAEKMGRKAATPAVEKAERKAAAKPVKKEKGVQKKATSDEKVEAGKKPAVGKSTGGRKKAA
jgi:Ni/Co efflux regulator RcnB